MNFQSTHIREVRVSYPKTEHERFACNTPDDIADFVRKVLPENSREHVIVLYLDVRNAVCGYSMMAIGATDSCVVPGREMFQRALIVGAMGIAIAHNHPSGITEPSPQDWAVTARIREGAKLLGLRVLDHVIVSDSEFTSMRTVRGWTD